MNAACGIEASADFAAIRSASRNMLTSCRPFVATAKRREAKARAAEAEGLAVTARDNYFMAAVHWGAAQWPLHRQRCGEPRLQRQQARLLRGLCAPRDHRIEPVFLRFAARRAGLVPSTAGYQGGRVPGRDLVSPAWTLQGAVRRLNGDRWLSRGVAVLALDGPGPGGMPPARPHRQHGELDHDREGRGRLVLARPEIDPARIGIFGNSFGSFFATLVTASEPRIMACIANCDLPEPGFHSIFEEASPTFKKRFMYMSGFTDEAAFDEFRQTLTWEGQRREDRVPYLCVAGEAEELSPLAHTERMLAGMSARGGL